MNYSKYCEECGSTNRVSICNKYNAQLCGKHRSQLYRHGKFLEQTKYTNNKIEIKDDHAVIYLNDKYGNIISETYVDIEDVEKVSKYKWFKRSDNRVVSNVSKYNIGVTHIRLHNYIMNIEYDYKTEVDHIDLNPLNNRRSNLRLGSKSKNLMNRGIQSNNKTGVCGVVSRDSNNTPPWIPQIKINRKMIRFGSEYSFDEAVKKRLISEADLFKTNSNNYNPKSNTIQLTYLSHDDKLQTFIECDLEGNIIKFEKLKGEKLNEKI